jgi:hypothetical protein
MNNQYFIDIIIPCRDGNYGDLMDVGLPPASPSEKDVDVQVRH